MPSCAAPEEVRCRHSPAVPSLASKAALLLSLAHGNAFPQLVALVKGGSTRPLTVDPKWCEDVAILCNCVISQPRSHLASLGVYMRRVVLFITSGATEDDRRVLKLAVVCEHHEVCTDSCPSRSKDEAEIGVKRVARYGPTTVPACSLEARIAR